METERTEKSKEQLAVEFVLFLLLLFPMVLLRAFVLTKLWGWFVVATFAAPPLSLAQAYGLELAVIAFAGAPTLRCKHDDRDLGKILGTSIGISLSLLTFGYLGKLFL